MANQKVNHVSELRSEELHDGLQVFDVIVEPAYFPGARRLKVASTTMDIT